MVELRDLEIREFNSRHLSSWEIMILCEKRMPGHVQVCHKDGKW